MGGRLLRQLLYVVDCVVGLALPVERHVFPKHVDMPWVAWLSGTLCCPGLYACDILRICPNFNFCDPLFTTQPEFPPGIPLHL